MGYQEYFVKTGNIRKLHEIICKDNVLTGLSLPVCFATAKTDIKDIKAGERLLVMAGERRGCFFNMKSLPARERIVLSRIKCIPIDNLVKPSTYNDYFEDSPLEGGDKP